jgi:hypothetical protein
MPTTAKYPELARAPTSCSGSPSPVSVNELRPNAATSSKTVFCFFQSKKFAGATRHLSFAGVRSHSDTSRSGSRYGSGLSNTALTTLKIAVFAPIPNASVITAIAVTLLCFNSIRTP